MSISSAMYAAVTGLSALSTGMQVISNNIANVNTVGFKAARTNYEDLISQDYLSNGRIQQIGRGVKVASVQQMFTQGSFINSAQDTDMAIAGEGFFQVRDRVTNELMYTRAGNFTFDANGVLETPAGYVLQGWELSIPKPGQEAVRIGTPTDVKVVILNAPPVETGQIKVVANLNADDSCAYIYSSAEWGEMYADAAARGPAEAARASAAELVYDFARDGSAYQNPSSAFNNAYVEWMRANGFTETSPGVFEKSAVTTPNARQQVSAAAAASQAASAALDVTYDSASIYYWADSSGVLWDAAYNSAYSNYLKGLGFTEDPRGNFFKTTRTPATAADKADANQTALAIAGIASYPSNSAAANATYLTNYDLHMRYGASLPYIPPVNNFAEPVAPADKTAAEAYAAASAGIASYSTANEYSALIYVEAYVHYLVANEGYTLSPDYQTPEVPGYFLASATPAAKAAAEAAASGAANAAFSLTGSVYTDYTTPEAKLLYNAEYLKSLSAAGYDVSIYTVPAAVPPDTDFTPPPAPTDYAAAQIYAAGQTDNWANLNTRAEKLAYMAYMAEYLGAQGSTYAPAVTDATALDFTATVSAPLPPADIGQARQAGVDHALQLDTNFTLYTNFPSSNEAANLAYAAGYTKWFIDNGYELDESQYTPPGMPADAQLTKEPQQADKDAANASGIAAAVAAGAPPTYEYPSGTDPPFSGWDQAYRVGYAAQMATRGFTVSTQSIDGYVSVQNVRPSQTEYSAARTAGLNDASRYADNTYPSTQPDAIYASAYNEAYENYMTGLGYSIVLPKYTEPYFEQVQVISATSAQKLDASNAAKAAAEKAALNAGQAAYNRVYTEIYNKTLEELRTQFAGSLWTLEGMGFAGAWDGTDKDSPIDPESYTHANPWTIYDSLGTAHTLMVYYQPNPYMENVWDYIITCDPSEDARKDVNNTLLMNGSTFAGIIQKGKITFTADGEDRHGGLIKDIEAQNIDMAKTAVAKLTNQVSSAQNPATAGTINDATFGGYYTGKPMFSAATGNLEATARGYTITWAGNLNTVPNVSGFTWIDTDGNSGVIQIYDKNYTGPYVFGSGLTINFSKGEVPMYFTSGDTVKVSAHSEAIGWTNLTPNTEGYFDFDVAFVQSASMALHPPYPEGLPTIIQHISLDMGARYNPAYENDGDKWILDEQGTTQYASKSLNIFSSQDGYPAGSLQRVSIDKDGVLTGIYTNGRHQPLYQIGLARFMNPWGLAKLGDNVYMETRWSGSVTLNPPGYGGTGTIRANFLEQSNTDLADEIVNMIVTQRGFQANSKVVTTTDTMLAEVIEMKR